jgi:hypothetical protein
VDRREGEGGEGADLAGVAEELGGGHGRRGEAAGVGGGGMA